MKKNETKYITMTGDELGVRLRELQGKLLTLRTQTVTEKVEDPTAIGKTRREVARVLTARRAQQLGIKHVATAKPSKPKATKPKAAKPAAKAPKAAVAGAKAKAPKAKRGSKKVSKKTASKSK